MPALQPETIDRILFALGGLLAGTLLARRTFRPWGAIPARQDEQPPRAHPPGHENEVQRCQELATRILGFLNANTSLNIALDHCAQALQQETSCEAIGIRLRQLEDYPYVLANGFSPEFLLAENRLCLRNPDQSTCRDAAGRIQLECTCGLVISGQIPPDAPYGTPAGSFWTNDTNALLEILAQRGDPRTHPRNRCLREGFQSLALIPIRAKGEIVGLLQLNHRAKNAFSRHLISMLEIMAVHIGEAILRRQVDAELAESLELTKEVTRLARIGGWQLDTAHRTVVLTDETRSILAVDAEFQPDLPRLLDFFVPPSRARLQEALEAAVLAGTPFDLDLELHAANGVARLAHVIGKAVWTENRITRVQGVIQDLTRQRQLEERLRQSEKLEAIGRLAGGIAHDFNNQLSGILGYADMLREHVHDPVHRSYAEQICHAGQHTAEHVRQLLAFGRKGKFLDAPMDLHTVIREVCELLRRSMDPRIAIRQQLAAGCARVKGDPSQLQNALLTLGLNARDAMPDGGTLTFTTRLSPPGEDALADLPKGPYLWLTVADTGAGMTEEARRHAFEPFFTTKGVGEGTGLGLASVYGTVINHHGAIRLSSEPGKGATFDLYLPILEEPSEAPPAPWEPRVVRGSGTILLVDDEPMIVDLGSAMLDSLGYRVTTCPSAEAAVAHYRQAWRNTDLVILDYTMPGQRGDQLFATLRGIHPGLRCLLSSGYSTPEEVPALLESGLCGFIQKPFLRQELSQAVAQALKKDP
jgi:two-component system cell cycle sensor histidine kinase/response regulator CckA